jgi:hypothetical protein
MVTADDQEFANRQIIGCRDNSVISNGWAGKALKINPT